MPCVLSIIGESDSGKTTLILRLLPELKNRGYRVAVAKHCPRGFDLDIEGKDSWRFARAGGEGIYLSSAKREAILRPRDGLFSIQEKLQSHFSDFDIVLMEGYNEEPGIKKMQILRRDIGKNPLTSNEIIAYISDMPLSTSKPTYKPDDILGIVTFIESLRND